MTRHFTALLVIAGLSGIAAQSKDGVAPGAPPAFEVSSVRPSAPSADGRMFVTYGPRAGGQWLSQNAPFLMILRSAYPTFALPGQIAGGPEWVNTARFDINAKAAGDPPRDAMADMLKTLLADRFKLRVHIEPREVDVYALTLARSGRLGPGLRKPAVDCEAVEAARKQANAAVSPAPAPPAPPKPGERPQCGALSTSMNGVLRLATGGTPVGIIPSILQSTVGRPIIDRTGLTGRWDIELVYAGTTAPATAADLPNAPASVFTALQEQLGLKLESRKERMDVLVIDQVEMPTAN